MAPGFEKVVAVFEAEIARSAGGGALAIFHRGEKVVDCWAGRRSAAGEPWRSDTLSLCFSTTKGVTASLLHTFADRGLVDYDAPVTRYWPEFGVNGKGSITVRQVLCHEAGLYRVADMVDHARRVLDWEYMVHALEQAEATHPPGRANAYHGLTFGWLVGEIVRRVGGLDFGDALHEALAEPLGVSGLFCGLPESELPRRAELMHPPPRQLSKSEQRRLRLLQGLLRLLSLGRLDLREGAAALVPPRGWELDWRSEEVARSPIPAASGMFDARSLARLYGALAGGGQVDGARIFSPQTCRELAVVQNRRRDRVLLFAPRWRLGYHRVLTLGRPRSEGFGHAGLGGSGGWADPARDLALGFVVNSGAGTPLGDARLVRISRAALAAADRRAQSPAGG